MCKSYEVEEVKAYRVKDKYFETLDEARDYVRELKVKNAIIRNLNSTRYGMRDIDHDYLAECLVKTVKSNKDLFKDLLQ